MDTRSQWLAHLQAMGRPVLEALAAGRLRNDMPVEEAPDCQSPRAGCTHLEAVARLLVGIAPWLELEGALPADEAVLQSEFRKLARRGLAHAVDPQSPDHLSFSGEPQALVDAAFLCQAMLRAPQQLWHSLDKQTRGHLVTEITATRKITPSDNNWLLFSATVECFLCMAGADWNTEPVEHAFRRHEEYYLGEGMYGDGPSFHWDYYNSYVIQPMLLDTVALFRQSNDPRIPPAWKEKWPTLLRRAQRYALMQEQLISPEGTFPLTGRSMCYRTGAFQTLCQVILLDALPEPLPCGQARQALSMVMDRMLSAPGTYDTESWLQLGIVGHQPRAAQYYISTGSLYLASTIFLPLGLAPGHTFWTDPSQPTTSQRLWAGEDIQPYSPSDL
jgi:hypothetical protein